MIKALHTGQRAAQAQQTRRAKLDEMLVSYSPLGQYCKRRIDKNQVPWLTRWAFVIVEGVLVRRALDCGLAPHRWLDHDDAHELIQQLVVAP